MGLPDHKRGKLTFDNSELPQSRKIVEHAEEDLPTVLVNVINLQLLEILPSCDISRTKLRTPIEF